jgi:trimethylamine--corrinoid protein Co-methyltransferase
VVDAQSGHEKTLTGLMPALAGANLIYGLGMIESGMTFDFGQLVMDNEFAGMIKLCVGGIPVSDETLALDVIGEVGPFGDFLSHDHTLAHMRAQSQPALIDRRVREDWKAAGSTTLYDRALEEARQILDTHVPDPLPDGVADELKAIIRDAEHELGVGR